MPSIKKNIPNTFVTPNQGLLYFETHQRSINDEWVLLVHGAGGSTRTWKKQIEQLGAHYNLLIIDLPGHGKNASNSNQFPNYSFLFMADKIWEVIDHLKIHKIHIIGVSLGTIICLQMRHLQPVRILSVIMPGAIVKLNTKLKSDQFPNYSFLFMADKIWEVIDHLKIHKIHIIGVSLGTIICLQMRHLQPVRILSVIMPGAIVKLNTKLKILASLSLAFAKIIGYRNFYKLSASIMLPRKNHKKSRDVFINESKALSINEFKKWTALYYNLNKTLLEFFDAKSPIPHLLIMGSQDHLFLKPARDYAIHHSNAKLKVIPDCGHVVSIESAKKFNRICLKFLKSLS